MKDTGHGTLYLSDATGIIFSESLSNHLYPNYEDLTDFYRVQSMRGVYIASQLADDNSIHTMITYDRGGEWQPIPRPEGLPCVDETKVMIFVLSLRLFQLCFSVFFFNSVKLFKVLLWSLKCLAIQVVIL